MLICPRCLNPTLDPTQEFNCLSHRDNTTYICKQCGNDENLINNKMMLPNEAEMRFCRTLGICFY